jgi:hypothetical protein
VQVPDDDEREDAEQERLGQTEPADASPGEHRLPLFSDPAAADAARPLVGGS